MTVLFLNSITADRLLVPLAPQEAVRDVVAIIHAKVKMFAGQGYVYDGPYASFP